MPLAPNILFEALVYTLLVGLVFAPLERLLPAHGARRALGMDLAFATIGALIVACALPYVAGRTLGALWHYSFVDLDYMTRATSWPARVGMVALAIVLFEVVGYLYHRAAHSSPILWRLHRVHHSAEDMDWLASFRQHPLEILLMTVLQNTPLVLLGLPLGEHAMVLLFIKANTVFVHSNLQIPAGPWSTLLAMPHFHHTHHRYGDESVKVVNYAAMFPWLDRLFGTYSDERSERFGLVEQTPSSFVRALLLARD